MTSYEPSPYGPDANNGASSQSNPYKKPQSDFTNEMTNAFTEAKESISSAFNEMRSESIGKQSKQTDSKTSFEDVKEQFKQMWASRPVRLPSDQGGDGKIAGVAEGIAVRYQVDPILVRTVFVVTAFCWGGSIALYLLAWMIMPRYSKTTSPIEDVFGENKDLPKDSKGKSTSEKSLGTTLLVIFLIGFFIPVMFSPGSLNMLFPIIAGIAGWYFLHKRRPDAPAGLLATPQASTQKQDEHIDLSMFEPVDGYPFPEGRTTPPSWDPLGAAPDTWHLPDPDPVNEAPKKDKKKRRWGRTLGITTAVIAAWGLVIGAIAVAFALFAAPSETAYDNWGHNEPVPATAADIEDHYDLGIGSFDLDLSQTTGLDELTEERTVTIDAGIGTIDLSLPEDTPVNVRCDYGIGENDCVDITHEDAMLTIDVDSGIGTTYIDYGFMQEEADRALTNAR